MSDALPGVPAPFAWRDGAIALDLPGGRALFTTRLPDAAGAVSDLGEEGGAAALAGRLGLPATRIAQSPQVHGAAIRVIRDPADLATAAPEADGQATALRGVACVVRVADCLPVVLIAPEAVAAVHAGWRGLAGGVLREGVRALRGLGASAIRAAIGPGARVCCYETGEEVHAALAHLGPAVREGDHADLAAAAHAILRAEDVSEIHDTRLCTMCAPEGLLWSHRRQRERAGRQGGVAWRS